jgi:hypothetical protein
MDKKFDLVVIGTGEAVKRGIQMSKRGLERRDHR